MACQTSAVVGLRIVSGEQPSPDRFLSLRRIERVQDEQMLARSSFGHRVVNSAACIKGARGVKVSVGHAPATTCMPFPRPTPSRPQNDKSNCACVCKNGQSKSEASKEAHPACQQAPPPSLQPRPPSQATLAGCWLSLLALLCSSCSATPQPRQGRCATVRCSLTRMRTKV